MSAPTPSSRFIPSGSEEIRRLLAVLGEKTLETFDVVDSAKSAESLAAALMELSSNEVDPRAD